MAGMVCVRSMYQSVIHDVAWYPTAHFDTHIISLNMPCYRHWYDCFRFQVQVHEVQQSSADRVLASLAVLTPFPSSFEFLAFSKPL